MQTTNHLEPKSKRQIVAPQQAVERRSEIRNPVFQSVTIECGNERVECFTTDISPRGIGLTHKDELRLGMATVIIPPEAEFAGDSERAVELLWTRICANGWRITGGEFIAS